jgi:hypothetical protein
MAEGTVLINRKSSLALYCPISRASASKKIFPPLLSGTKISKMERSKQIEVVAATALSSSSV